MLTKTKKSAKTAQPPEEELRKKYALKQVQKFYKNLMRAIHKTERHPENYSEIVQGLSLYEDQAFHALENLAEKSPELSDEEYNKESAKIIQAIAQDVYVVSYGEPKEIYQTKTGQIRTFGIRGDWRVKPYPAGKIKNVGDWRVDVAKEEDAPKATETPAEKHEDSAEEIYEKTGVNQTLENIQKRKELYFKTKLLEKKEDFVFLTAPTRSQRTEDFAFLTDEETKLLTAFRAQLVELSKNGNRKRAPKPLRKILNVLKGRD